VKEELEEVARSSLSR